MACLFLVRVMIVNVLIGIFIGFFGRGIYNKHIVSKVEEAAFRVVELNCLRLLAMTCQDYHYLSEKKIMMMHDLGVDENEIKTTRNVDEQNIIRWQKAAISKFLLALPPQYRKLVSYRNWRGAMVFLRAFEKKA